MVLADTEVLKKDLTSREGQARPADITPSSGWQDPRPRVAHSCQDLPVSTCGDSGQVVSAPAGRAGPGYHISGGRGLSSLFLGPPSAAIWPPEFPGKSSCPQPPNPTLALARLSKAHQGARRTDICMPGCTRVSVLTPPAWGLSSGCSAWCCGDEDLRAATDQFQGMPRFLVPAHDDRKDSDP